MKKVTGLKRLSMEAQEIQKNIEWLEQQLSELKLNHPRNRVISQIKAQAKRLKGIQYKAEAYGKGTTVWVIEVEVKYRSDTQSQSVVKTIYYTGVEKDELDLLIGRDFKGLNYRVLMKNAIKTGEIL